MKYDADWEVVRACFRCGRELQGLLKGLKEHAESAEYEEYAYDIATAIDAVNARLLNKALKRRPELERRIESDLARLGRLSE